MNNKIISQKIDIIDDILECLKDELNHFLRKDNPNIQLIEILNNDKKQYENVIIKFINYHINRFNQTMTYRSDYTL